MNYIYPYIIGHYTFPVDFIKQLTKKDSLEIFFGFIRVIVKSPEVLHKPFLPVRKDR